MAESRQVTATARSVSGILRAAGYSASCVTEGAIVTVAFDWQGEDRFDAARALLEARGFEVTKAIPARGWLFLRGAR